MQNQVLERKANEDRFTIPAKILPEKKAKMISLLPILAGGLTVGLVASGKWRNIAHIFGIRTEETLKYRVIMREGNKELREYPSYGIAITQGEGPFDRAQRKAFFRLFRYISGHNTSSKKIKMTLPVLRDMKGEKIQMTAPVIQEKTTHGWAMAFTIPSKYSLETVPKPIDKEISLLEVPAGRFAILTFSGFRSELNFRRKQAELEQWLSEKQMKPLSGPTFAGFDPPFTIPFLKRNEVQIRVSN